MNLNDLLRQLALGELKNFSFAEGGAFKEEAIPSIIESVNTSLNDLHTRFLLNEKELHLLCFASKTRYPLRAEHALTNTTPNTPKYILDTVDYPFTGDLIQIISVYDEIGIQVTRDDIGNCGSIFIPRYDTVQVTNPTNDKMLIVMYQAQHPKITLAADSFLDQEIILPPILEEALRCRIASRVYSPMDRENQAAKVLLLEQKYEMICQEAEQRNLINGAAFTTTWKLESRGFV